MLEQNRVYFVATWYTQTQYSAQQKTRTLVAATGSRKGTSGLPVK